VIGYQNFIKLQPVIDKWLIEAGLSEVTLKKKLISLVSAKETRLIKIKGHTPEDDLGAGVRQLAVTHKMEWAGKGEDAEPFDDGETLLAVDMESIETQRKTLDMALKVKGLYAPEKRQHTGPDGGPIETKAIMSLDDATRIYLDNLQK